MPEWDKEKPPTLIISDCGHVPTFLEKCGVKSLDEIPVELPIVNWNWTVKNHRSYVDYPVIKERIPLPGASVWSSSLGQRQTGRGGAHGVHRGTCLTRRESECTVLDDR